MLIIINGKNNNSAKALNNLIQLLSTRLWAHNSLMILTMMLAEGFDLKERDLLNNY